MNNYKIVRRDEYDEFGKVERSRYIIKEYKKFLFWYSWEPLYYRDDLVEFRLREQAEEYIKNMKFRNVIIETDIEFL